MKLDEFKKPAIYGGIFLGVIIVLEFFIIFTCKEELGCLAFALIVGLPSVLIGLSSRSYLGFIFNILFYFLVGAFIGFLAQKFKK